MSYHLQINLIILIVIHAAPQLPHDVQVIPDPDVEGGLGLLVNWKEVSLTL